MINNYYRKIANVFSFDEKYREIKGINEPYNTLKNIEWIGTEKIDGTSVVVHYDGERIEFGGHTAKSQLPDSLIKYLTDTFMTKEMEYVFEQLFEDKEVYIYGEGFGSKIQANGDKYIKDGVGFIVFEINIDGFDLSRENINDIASKLGLPFVPEVFKGTLDEAIDFVSKHPNSAYNEAHEMEGLVLQPTVTLYDSKKKLIKCKCKWCDIKESINNKKIYGGF